MKAQLIVTDGPDRGTVFKLMEGQTLSVGRGRDTDTMLQDFHASRNQCTVSMQDEVVALKDLDSSGGTFVNGKQVTDHVMAIGDVISFGSTRMLLREYQLLDSQSVSLAPVRPDEEVTALLEAPPKPDGGIASAGPESWLGRTIHKYVIEEPIALGSTGTVYKAKFTEKDRPVALKVYGPDISESQNGRERFLRGMKTMFGVRHPNIVRILNAGEQDGHCWVAMEYVEGRNLKQIVQYIGLAGMLDWTVALRIAVHIARALEHAYEKQIVHRNITPRNILFRSEDQVALLGDLILAKALEGSHAQQITKAGEILGEIAYMSPERISDATHADGRSDIYGLGATIYALLTGRPPFEALSMAGIIQKIRDEEPVAPKHYQLSINDMFEGLVLRMIAKRPEDRFQTPTMLLHDLERIAQFEKVDI